MRTIAIFIFCFVSLFLIQNTQAQKVITNLDELLNYANQKSLTFKNGEIQVSQAKKATVAALYGIADPTGNLSGTYTNNTKLPVNIFPAEILGGQPGTYKEVQLGVQYQTNFNANVDIKLFNRQGWENLKLSKINVDLTDSDTKLSRKSLYDNVTIIYFNIVTLQEQLKATELNLLAADTLLQSVNQRYNQGIAKQQDVNDSKVNKLTIEETLRQIRFQTQQQYTAINQLCDIPSGEKIQISHPVSGNYAETIPVIETNGLPLSNARFREKFAYTNYQKTLFGNLPTLSFFASVSTQQYNTQATFFDGNVNWIPSNYVGIKLNLPIPSSNSIAQIHKTKFDYLISKNNTEQARIKADLDIRQLQYEYEKAFSQRKSNQEIYALRKDSYKKNVLNYKAGITNIDQTINSFNAMVNSNYDIIASSINILFAEAKINLQNKIK
jgi:outer membrane protein TolC